MSKKTVEIQAVGAIDYNKQKIKPGETFTCLKEEAERLIELGAARIPVPNTPQQSADPEFTVEILRKKYPTLVTEIETEARQGYVDQTEVSKDFDALRKELEEAKAALDKAIAKN